MECLPYIETFLAVFRTSSFSAAARELHLSQPSVSRQIQRLEEILACQLFMRDTHRVIATPHATTLARQLDPLVGDIRQVLHNTARGRDELEGTLRIACLPEVGERIFLRLILDFQQRHPAIQVEIQYTRSDVILDAVLEGKADFGITARMRSSENLLTFPLTEEEIVMVTRTRNQRAPREWPDARPPFVMFRRDSELVPRFLNRHRKRLGLRGFLPYFAVNSQTSMIQALLANDSFAIMPYHAVHSMLEAGQLKLVIEDGLAQGVYLHHYANPHMHMVARLFKKTLIEACRRLDFAPLRRAGTAT